MQTFTEAIRRHTSVADAARFDRDAAAPIWDAIAEIGEPKPGSHGAAVRDTMPTEHVTLLATCPSAVACAFSLHWKRGGAAGRAKTDLARRDLAREIWDEFGERATFTGEINRGFGWTMNEAWEHFEDVQIATGDTFSVQRIAQMAGRMYAALRGANARRVLGIPEEVHSVELGANLARLLPAELASLVDGDLADMALIRFSEKRMLQYAMRGNNKSAKGPLVMVLDESASMNAARREWSKAAAVALMRVAFDEKRVCAVVHFATSCDVVEVKPGDSAAMMKVIRHWYNGGGTNIGLALATAAETVRTLTAKGQGGADVVLVTDGVDGDTSGQRAAVAKLAEQSARLWTVAIGTSIAPTSPLRETAAAYTQLGDHELGEKAVLQFGKAAT